MLPATDCCLFLKLSQAQRDHCWCSIPLSSTDFVMVIFNLKMQTLSGEQCSKTYSTNSCVHVGILFCFFYLFVLGFGVGFGFVLVFVLFCSSPIPPSPSLGFLWLIKSGFNFLSLTEACHLLAGSAELCAHALLSLYLEARSIFPGTF